MANSYTISPGIVVGNFTTTLDVFIGRDLTVENNFVQKIHLNTSGPLPGLGFNYNPLGQVQDDPTRFSFALLSDFNAGRPTYVRGSNAGVLKTVLPPIVELLNGNSAANTGNVTENTIFSTVLQGQSLGTSGQLKIWIYINVTAQGAVATTIRVKLGSVIISSQTWTTVADRLYDLTMVNLGAVNSQKTGAIVHTNGATPNMGVSATAVDTSVAQTLSITLQNGATTDSSNIPVAHAILMGSSGAV